RLPDSEAASRVRAGERSCLPRRNLALRAPVQPAQPSSHGVYRVREFGGILLERSEEARAGDWSQVPLRDHATQLSDLRSLRRVPQEEWFTPDCLGNPDVNFVWILRSLDAGHLGVLSALRSAGARRDFVCARSGGVGRGGARGRAGREEAA